MPISRNFRLLTAAAGLGLLCAAPPPAAHAQALRSQPSNVGVAYASQVFTDFPAFNTYSFDDFTVTGSGWDITKVTVYGKEFIGGNAAYNTAVSLAITTAPNAAAIGTTYSGVETGGNLVFTQPIHLAPGGYFLTAYVTRPFIRGGQWGIDESTPVSGSAFWFDNPGGGFGDGKSAFHIDPGHDLAFEIDGSSQKTALFSSVPEPSSVAAFGMTFLGTAGLILRARKRKA